MEKDLVYVFDKITQKSSLLGEIQSDFNMSQVIDGTKDSTTIIVWSYSSVEIEPWSIILHKKTMTWWCVSHDKVERYQNDDGSFVWLHNLELLGAIELLNARDLTDCGFNDNTYTVDEFIKRLFELGDYKYDIFYSSDIDLNFLSKKVEFIKTFENYTLLSALREFLDAYNMCPKLGFGYSYNSSTDTYTIEDLRLSIIPKTGNRLRTHQMSDFDDVRETKTMDKNSFGTTVVSNAENVISTQSKTFPSTGSIKLSSVEETISAINGILRLPSKVFKGNWIKMFSNGYFTISLGANQVYVDVNPTNEYSIDSFIYKIQSFITTNIPSILNDFNSQIEIVKEKITKACCVTLFDGNKIVPYFGGGNNQNGKNIIEKGDNVPYLATLMLNGGAEKEIIFTDKQTRDTLNDKKQGIAWERGSNLITGFDFLNGSRGAELTIQTVSLYNDLQGTAVYSNGSLWVGLRASHLIDDEVIYLRYTVKNTTFIVNYIPMSDIKIKIDNQRDKKDVQLYNQNGKITDSVALSKLLNSYSKEISSDTITRYMHYYSYSDVPKVGDIVIDSENNEYVINNVSMDFTQNETSVANNFDYFIDCEITMSKWVSTKSLMVNPNTNIRDYGIPQNYNVKRKQLYRDYYELTYDFYDDANQETPYLATNKIFNFPHYSIAFDNFIAVMKLGYAQRVEGQDYWYYQLETTNYYMSKMIYVVLDFNDNNIIGYGSQNVFSGFDISRIFSGLTDILNTPVSYVDNKGNVESISIKLCTNEQLTNVYDIYQQDQVGGDSYTGSLYNYSVLITHEIYDWAGSNNYSILINEYEYKKDALEVPVFEYVCQIDDSNDVLIGDSILQERDGYLYFYSYVNGSNINQNNAFTTTRVIHDTDNDTYGVNLACEFSFDSNENELSISIWNWCIYNPATGQWQFGTRNSYNEGDDYAVFRHAYNIETGEEIIDLMFIAKRVPHSGTSNLVLKVNYYKLK